MNDGRDEVDVAEETCRTDVAYVLVETKVRRDRDTEKTDVLAVLYSYRIIWTVLWSVELNSDQLRCCS